MFQTYLIHPIYNGFIYLIGVVPGGDVGFAIILLTLIIRAVLYPVFTASIRTQMGMQAVQGELDEINEKYKDNSEERAKLTMQLFKDHKVRPFAGFVALFVQIPIFIALYYAFFKEDLPHVATQILYPFVHAPQVINLEFLGFVNLLTPHNIILAGIVGILQYFVVYFSLARTNKPGLQTTQNPQKQATQKMQQRMMLYFMPALMTVVSYSLPAAVGVYFAATNAVSLGQEWLIRKHMFKN